MTMHRANVFAWDWSSYSRLKHYMPAASFISSTRPAIRSWPARARMVSRVAHCAAQYPAANSHPGADGIEIDLDFGFEIDLTQALPDITESVSISGLARITLPCDEARVRFIASST